MKANLTRGNSVTENYKPYENITVADSIHLACLIVADALEQYRKRRPIPNFIKGGTFQPGPAMIGESGLEMIKLPSGKVIMPHSETIKIVKEFDIHECSFTRYGIKPGGSIKYEHESPRR